MQKLVMVLVVVVMVEVVVVVRGIGGVVVFRHGGVCWC